MRRTNSDSLRCCHCFRVFRLNFAPDFFNLLVVRFHQAKMILVKHLIRGSNNEAWVGVEASTLPSWRSKPFGCRLSNHAALMFKRLKVWFCHQRHRFRFWLLML